jgi:HD-like signal output (HDOD) protein
MHIASDSPEPVSRAHILRTASSLGLLGTSAQQAVTVISRLCDPRASLAEVAELIEPHPALCLRVLRIANSPYYGHRRSVSTIKQAVYLLGLDAVRGVATAACIDRSIPRSKGMPVDFSSILRHSIATAVAAESLAAEISKELATEAFVAGVLHNLGVAVQASIDARGVKAMIAARREHPTGDLRALEAEHALVCHERCAEVVFEEWQLPQRLVQATAHHHRPQEAPPEHRDLAAIVGVGANLALACGYTSPLEPEPVQLDADLIQDLGLTAVDSGDWVASLSPKIEQLVQALLGR